ncbi:MAG: NrfD/PsrC family molybdoenzyme membrane anchor subunit [Candidatus Thermoplasmatota archaeon]
MAEPMTETERVLLRPVAYWSLRFKVFIAVLAGIVAWGVFAYTVQLREGLVVTNMRDTVLWGLYVGNFVFFIGISHVGALMSAILRLAGAEWRRPITRMAEAITVCSLFVGAAMPIVDLGRPDRLLNVLAFGRIQSAILWDFVSIFTYLTGSLLFLYLFLLLPTVLR